MHAWMYPLIVLAAIGLILSCLVHLAAWLGVPVPAGANVLHYGIVVVWLPTIYVSNRLVKDFKHQDFWNAALRGCPAWMRYLVNGCFAYAFVSFGGFLVYHLVTGHALPMVRSLSGHWMAFYSAAFAVLYSGAQVERYDHQRRCPLGHPVSPSAEYCDQCGNPIVRTE